jgi:hypothetical protein
MKSLLGTLFYIVLPLPPLGHLFCCDNYLKVDGKIKPKDGSRGCPPHAASPSGEERGHPHSLSKILKIG